MTPTGTLNISNVTSSNWGTWTSGTPVIDANGFHISSPMGRQSTSNQNWVGIVDGSTGSNTWSAGTNAHSLGKSAYDNNNNNVSVIKLRSTRKMYFRVTGCTAAYALVLATASYSSTISAYEYTSSRAGSASKTASTNSTTATEISVTELDPTKTYEIELSGSHDSDGCLFYEICFASSVSRYKVTYKANGGTGDDVVREYLSGTTVYVAPNYMFSRSGYIFTGWNTADDASGTHYDFYTNDASYYHQSLTLTEDVTLYAKWKAEETTNSATRYCISVWNSSNNGKPYFTQKIGDKDEYMMNYIVPDKDASSNWPKFWVGKNNSFYKDKLGSNDNSKSVEDELADISIKSQRSRKLGLAAGALGTLHINDRSGDDNLYICFLPKRYGIVTGSGALASSAAGISFYTTEYDNEWITDMVQMTSTMKSGNYYVGFMKSDGTFVKSEATDRSCISVQATMSSMGIYVRGTGWSANQVGTEIADDSYGAFRLWSNTDQNNFTCHWVPYYALKYNANSGSGAPAITGVAQEGSSAQRTIKISSTEPTRNGYSFGGWATSSANASDGTKAYDPGDDITLSADVELFAIWTCVDPTIGTDLSEDQVDKYVGDASPTLTVAATAAGGSVSYQWYSNTSKSTTSPTPTTLTNCTTATYNPSTAAAGTTYYFCKMTNSTAGCSNEVYSKIAKVVVSRVNPIQYTVSGTASICAGGNTDITLSGSQSGASYQLKIGGEATGDPKDGTGSSLTWNVSTTGTYTVSAVQTTKYLARDMSSSATVSAKTATGVTVDDATLDDAVVGEEYTISGITGAGAGTLTYQWYSYSDDEGNGETEIDGAESDTYAFTPDAEGDYYFKCEVTGDCGSVKSDLITVTATEVCSEPTTSFADSYCNIGSTLDLRTLISNSQGDGTITYAVTDAGGTSASIADGYKFSATAVGTATVTATQAADATNGYCEKVMTADIVVDPQPSSSVNFEQMVLDNSKKYSYATALSAAHIAYSVGDNPLDSLDESKSSRNEPYLGIKLKPANSYIQVVVPRENTLKVKFGHISEKIAYFIDDVKQDSLATSTTVLEVAADASSSHTYKFQLKTKDKTLVFKQIMIGEAIQSVTLPARITMGSPSNGSISVTGTDDGKKVVNVGSTVTVNVSPDSNYELATLTYVKTGSDDTPTDITGGDLSEDSYSFDMPNYNVTINATFVASCTALSTTPGTGSATVTGKTTATLPYTLTNTTGVASVTVKVYEGSTLRQTFAGLTATTSGSCSATGLSAGTTYTYTVTPIASSGYCDGDESSKSSTFTTKYGVTYADGGKDGGGDAPTDSNGYDEDDKVTVLGNPNTMTKTGYTFRGWTYGDYFYVEDNKFDMPDDNVTLTAVWDSYSAGGSGTKYRIPVKSAYDDQGSSATPRYLWVTDDIGWLTWDEGANSISSDEASYSDFSYRTKSGKNTILIYSEIASVKKIRLYCYGSNAFSCNGISTGTTYGSYSALTESTDYTFNGNSISSSANGVIEIIFSTALAANTYVQFKFSANGKFYGVELETTGGGSGSWTNKYVAFDDMTGFTGSSTLPDSIKGVPSGKKVVQPANPTATGYTFGGWYADAACTTTTFGWGGAIDKDTTVYAKWMVNNYTLTLDDDFIMDKGESGWEYGTAGDGSKAVTYDASTNLTSAFTKPAREGYIFGGYYTERDGSGTQLVDEDGAVKASVTGYTDEDKKWKHDGDLTIYAKWTDDKVYYFHRPIIGSGDRLWSNTANWTKHKVPSSIEDTIYVLDWVDIKNTTVAVADVRICGKYSGYTTYTPVNGDSAYTPNGYVDIYYNAALLVTDSIRGYNTSTGKREHTSTGQIWIYASDVFDEDHIAGKSGVLITKKQHLGNEAMVQYSTAACKKTYDYYDTEKDEWVYDKVDYINQYFGIPFAETYVSSYYGVYMYKYLAASNSFQTYGNGIMEPFSAYMLLSASPGYGVNFEMRGQLLLPGISSEATDTVLTLARRAADVEESKPTTNMFANSWMGPLDITAFEASDFVNCEAAFYLFNAGSKTDSLINNQAGKSDEAGQWSTLSVSAVKADPELQQVLPPMQSFLLITDADKDAEQTYTLTLDYKKHVYDPALARIEAGQDIPIIPVRAPKRTTEEDINAPEIMRLFVEGETGTGDHVYMYLRDDFTSGFDNTWDGRKITGSSYAPQLYAMSDAGKMALNAVDDAEGTVIGFRKSVQESSFTFTFDYNGTGMWYLNDLKEQKSTLIDNESSYTFFSESGDNSARFIISATPISPVITNIDQTNGKEAKARKLIINDHVYIIRNGRMYSIDGAAVK